jgi:hypothetical protein
LSSNSFATFERGMRFNDDELLNAMSTVVLGAGGDAAAPNQARF